jgi:hypothetical protein
MSKLVHKQAEGVAGDGLERHGGQLSIGMIPRLRA